MKKFLRKWLEVPEVPEVPDMSEYVNKNDIKEAVENAIYEALQPELPADYTRHWFMCNHKDIRGTLIKHIKSLAGETANSQARAALKELTEPESFIDGVVERIKNKQLAT